MLDLHTKDTFSIKNKETQLIRAQSDIENYQARAMQLENEMKQMKIRHEQELVALRRTLEREKQLLRSSVSGISSPKPQRPTSLYGMPPSRTSAAAVADIGGYHHHRESYLASPTKSSIPADSMHSQHDNRYEESQHEEMDLDEGYHHHHQQQQQQQLQQPREHIKRTTAGYNDPRLDQVGGEGRRSDALGIRNSYHEGMSNNNNGNSSASPIKSRFEIQSETDKHAHDWKRASEVTDELRRRITEMKKRSEMNKAMYGSK